MSRELGKRGIALFDMDQTLVQWDTQLLFCNWVLRHEGWRRFYLLLFLPAVPFAKLLGAEGLKRIFLSFLWGMRRERLDELVAGFVERYVPGEFYPEMLGELAKEKERGRFTVMTSASPEIYAGPIGEALGFDATHGTRVEFGDTAPLFPEFPRGNNKGSVKVDRLREEFGIEPVGGKLPDSAGYSDSKADLPMLEICEEVTAVHPEGIYAERAASEEWRIMHPLRSWKDRREFAWACLKMVLGVFPAVRM